MACLEDFRLSALIAKGSIEAIGFLAFFRIEGDGTLILRFDNRVMALLVGHEGSYTHSNSNSLTTTVVSGVKGHVIGLG